MVAWQPEAGSVMVTAAVWAPTPVGSMPEQLPEVAAPPSKVQLHVAPAIAPPPT